jgi:hypothetical protein
MRQRERSAMKLWTRKRVTLLAVVAGVGVAVGGIALQKERGRSSGARGVKSRPRQRIGDPVARRVHTLSDDDWETIVIAVRRWREHAEELAEVFAKQGDDRSHRGAVAMVEMADEILGRLGCGRDRMTPSGTR